MQADLSEHSGGGTIAEYGLDYFALNRSAYRPPLPVCMQMIYAHCGKVNLPSDFRGKLLPHQDILTRTARLWVLRVHWFFVIALWPLLYIIPETHGPTILSRRTKRLRAGGNSNAYAAHELHTLTTKDLVRRNIGRPLGKQNLDEAK